LPVRRSPPPIRHDAGGLAWSPDGKQIAFSDFGAIYVIKKDGSGRRPIASRRTIAGDWPSWSPDGKELAFSDYYAGVIRVVQSDGTSDRVIYHGTQVSRPAWSPDGRSIAFDWDPANGRASLIGVMPAGGGGVRVLARNGWCPAWSPDGSMIAYCTSKAVYVIHADGSGQHLVARVFAGGVSWSPDGRRIAIGTGDAGIQVVQSDGTGRHRLTHGNYFDTYPDWSPDGNSIAFDRAHCDPKIHPCTTDTGSSIYVVTADGSALRRLTPW
jgi:Tol biopolymer transport system component